MNAKTFPFIYIYKNVESIDIFYWFIVYLCIFVCGF